MDQDFSGKYLDDLIGKYLDEKNCLDCANRLGTKQFFSTHDSVGEAFFVLANRIYDGAGFERGFKFQPKQDVVLDMVSAAWSKIDRFATGSGRAFNYFTTIMLCSARQLYRGGKHAKNS